MHRFAFDRARRISLAAGFGLTLAGCGIDTAEDRPCEAPTHPDLRWLEANVFTPSCGGAACHADAASARAGLALVASPGGTIHDELLAPAVEDAARGAPRIAPGDCAGSYLYRKITGDDIGGTRRMPPAAPLCATHVDAICAWIEAGAQPASDGGAAPRGAR